MLIYHNKNANLEFLKKLSEILFLKQRLRTILNYWNEMENSCLLIFSDNFLKCLVITVCICIYKKNI